MTCNQCLGIEREFDRQTAQKNLRQYRRQGAGRSTKVLLEMLLACGVEQASLLDIGGGVGAIQHALLEKGATSATSVDASTAYLEAALQEADRRGLAERIQAVHGDFVAVANSVAKADIVTLDRVLCCYHDVQALVDRSAEKAIRLYGIVFPRETWWLRPFFALGNAYLRLCHSPFRVFLHPQSEIESGVARRGLRKVRQQDVGIWRVAVFAT